MKFAEKIEDILFNESTHKLMSVLFVPFRSSIFFFPFLFIISPSGNLLQFEPLLTDHNNWNHLEKKKKQKTKNKKKTKKNKNKNKKLIPRGLFQP